MSCLRLKLPPARKVWKSFTSKLCKLHKLHSSKAIKKPRNRLHTTTAPIARPSKFLQHKRKFTCRAYLGPIYKVHKKQAPVYIDKLFKEPVLELADNLRAPVIKNRSTAKNVKLFYQPADVPETSKEGEADIPSSSDDMWESLPLASPLTRGIDERAEQFITRFRAEMEVQEMLAGNL
ncbi:DUF761 domain protein [Quillaja saponaria]|uniref:DUF761 domain protein n=1 Tax=Quillaja saponaria TaxID=32244 RepID=A0AAD7VIR6_QUISA|nr:DUF761 domain protein [Quillaja saponaria]